MKVSDMAEAILTNGKKIQYVIKDNPPKGAMKYTYFTPDKGCVVQFFLDPKAGENPDWHKRMAAILGRYNPTLSAENGGALGNSQKIANYFVKKFCWPTALVEKPQFGIVAPSYPSDFFFDEMSSKHIQLKGRDKKSNWFTTRNRRYLEPYELGDFKAMLEIALSLAQSIRKLHQSGLAHADLSCNNVLIDPPHAKCVVIDIDSLVVPNIFPPQVAGTHGYIAPEVLETQNLPFGSAERKLPSTSTDLHALAVLIYEYLCLRHPLIGPKVYCKDPEKDDYLMLGPKATFIESPTDLSNRPKDLPFTIHDMGPDLEQLFIRAFSDGLHNPNQRPTALEWEKGLLKTKDLLYPCPNPHCGAKWFILYDTNRPVCPFCGQRIRTENIVRLHFRTRRYGTKGQWIETHTVNVYHKMPLFSWHFYANTFQDEKADHNLLAYIVKENGKWLLVNHAVHNMTDPFGYPVPIGQAVILQEGAVFKGSESSNGLLIETERFYSDGFYP